MSFVLDIADLYKMEHIVPLAFGLVAKKGYDPEPWPTLEMDVRRACRDFFRKSRLLSQIVEDCTGVVDVAGSP